MGFFIGIESVRADDLGMYLLGFTVFLFLHHILLNLSPGFHLGRVGLGLGPNVIGRSRSFESFFFFYFSRVWSMVPKKKEKRDGNLPRSADLHRKALDLEGPRKAPR